MSYLIRKWTKTTIGFAYGHGKDQDEEDRYGPLNAKSKM